MNLVVSLLSEVQAAGGTAIARGEKLRVQAPQPLPVELIAALRAHKADVLVALARAGNTNVSPVHEESEWTADDWLAYFDVRADDFERDCKLDLAEAELRAFKITVVHWMNRNPVSDPGRDICAACGNRLGRPGEDGVPVLNGKQRCVWLHHGCHRQFEAQRRGEAVAALAAIGINPPGEST